MGIVLDAAHRGKGYSTEALRLLLAEAFDRLGASEVRNDFELERSAALKAHLAAGFRVIGEEDGIVRVGITMNDSFKLTLYNCNDKTRDDLFLLKKLLWSII